MFEHRTCLYFLAYGMGGGVSAPLPSTTPSRMRERLLISLHNASNSSSTSIDEILEGLVSLGREKTVAAANEVKSFVEETDGIVEFDVLKWSIEDKFGVEFGSGDDQLNTYLKSLSLSADNNASDCLIIKGGRTYVDVQRLFANIGQPFSPLPRDAGDVCSAVWRGDENEDKAEENTHDEGESLKNDRDDDNIDDKDEDDDGEVDNAFTDLSHLLKIPGWVSVPDSKTNRIPLHHYASIGDYSACELLVSAGSNIFHRDVYGKTAGNIAEEFGYPAVAEFLSTDDRPEQMEGGPILAALSSPPSNAKLLLDSPLKSEKGTPPNAIPSGETPRSLSKKGDLASLKKFDLNNPDYDWKNETDAFDSCSLYYACHSGAAVNDEVVSFLLEKKGGLANIDKEVLDRCRKNSIHGGVKKMLVLKKADNNGDIGGTGKGDKGIEQSDGDEKIILGDDTEMRKNNNHEEKKEEEAEAAADAINKSAGLTGDCEGMFDSPEGRGIALLFGGDELNLADY